jgi:L-arabinokinase
MLVCYISGHGFGHAVRTMEVIRALWRRQPDLPVQIRTSLPEWLLRFNLRGPFTVVPVRSDVGAVQDDSLRVQPAATLRAYREFARDLPRLLASEVAAVRELRPRLIFADIPALAFDVADALGVPALGMTNFSWDWIYADYVRDFPADADLVAALRTSYGRAALLLRLPLYGDLSAFPHIRDIPFVARTAEVPSAETRRRLDLPSGERLVLLSFGGIGIALRHLPRAVSGVTFVVTEAGHDTVPPPCRVVSSAAMTSADVHYQDLVAAVDAVMTKPGYGIVAECIANRTPMIYTSRGRFAEYPCLVAGVQRYLTNAFISNDDLYAGHWETALEAIFGQPRRDVAVATNGAEVAAQVLLEYLA